MTQKSTLNRSIRSYPDLMTVKDIQHILQIGRSTTYKLIRSGELKTLRIGTIYRIPKVCLLEYMEKTLEDVGQRMLYCGQDEYIPRRPERSEG